MYKRQLQDSTPRCPGLETKSLVYISALSYAVSSRFPDFPLGLIIESNDAQNAVTIAAAAHFQYVRCKVFVGAMQKPGGMMDGNAAEAFHFRKMVDRDISLFADIFDRMGAPLYDRDYPLAISQAKKYGAEDVYKRQTMPTPFLIASMGEEIFSIFFPLM